MRHGSWWVQLAKWARRELESTMGSDVDSADLKTNNKSCAGREYHEIKRLETH